MLPACDSQVRPSPLALRGLKPVSVLGAARPHGDRLRYQAGCRCDECRAANAAYERERIAERKAGRANHIVPADRARNWLKHLSAQGVGKNSVADVSGVARVLLQEILAGRREHIRASTERKILAVTPDMAADRALIDATETWRLINELLECGWTKQALARHLGMTRTIQFDRHRVTVRNAARVRRMHRELFDPCMALVSSERSRELIASLREEGFTDKAIERHLGEDCLDAVEKARLSKAMENRIVETYRRLTE